MENKKAVFFLLLVGVFVQLYVVQKHHSRNVRDYNSAGNIKQAAIIESQFLEKNKSQSGANPLSRDPSNISKDLAKSDSSSGIVASPRHPKQVLSRVPLTPEVWQYQKEHATQTVRKAYDLVDKLGRGYPETMIVASENQTIVNSEEISASSKCEGLSEANWALTVSIDEKGQVQDAMNVDPKNTEAIPLGIYNCTFAPYVGTTGQAQAVMTTLVPPNERQYVDNLLQTVIEK